MEDWVRLQDALARVRREGGDFHRNCLPRAALGEHVAGSITSSRLDLAPDRPVTCLVRGADEEWTAAATVAALCRLEAGGTSPGDRHSTCSQGPAA